MNKFLTILLVLIFFIPIRICFAQEKMAIEVLYENGIIKGDEENLAPNRYMTCGEFATVASRIYAEDYEVMEKHFGDWKEATLFYARSFCNEKDVYENLEINFDIPISPEFAHNILLEMLEPHFKNGTYIGYIYWVGNGKQIVIGFEDLADLGYDLTIIPDSEYLTREQGCEMLCELLYLEYPVVGDYLPSVLIEQYTLHGREVVYEIHDGDISSEMFGNRPSREGNNKWNLPNDIRSKTFLNENITVGMSREAVEELIGVAYKCREETVWYYYYTPQTEDGERGYIKIEYVDEKVGRISFESE